MNEDEIQQIVDYLVAKGYLWKIDGELRYPTDQHVRAALESCVQTVRDGASQGEDLTVELGRLLVKRTDNKIDIYLHAGELDL